jgi:DNA-binding Xre family transcriptional regulator
LSPLHYILQCCIPQGDGPAEAVFPDEKDIMVRLTISELMARRGITAYALSRGSQLSYPSAYRLSRAGGSFGRLHADTLDELCKFFQVQPGELLEWTPAGTS